MATETTGTETTGVEEAAPARRRRATFGDVAGGALLLGLIGGMVVLAVTGTCLKPKGWLALTITGLTVGFIYAMIALGYTMVYGVLQLINFAHSEVFMVGSFAGLYAIRGIFGIEAEPDLGASGAFLVLVLLVGLLLAALASGVLAVLMERIAYRPLRRHGASRLNYLITAIGVSLFLTNLFQLFDGHSHLGLPSWLWPNIAGKAPVQYPNFMNEQNALTLGGVGISNRQILIAVVAIVMMIALDQFVARSRTGKGIRAVAEDPETASLMGVNIDRIIVLTFFIGGLMAGAAGLLFGMFYTQAVYNMGFVPGIKAFTAAVLGGIGNIRGAMLGGVTLGLVENLGSACIGTQWKDVIAFSVLVLVLMFRPTGLLGERVGG